LGGGFPNQVKDIQKDLKIQNNEQKNFSTIKEKKEKQTRFYGQDGFCQR